MTDDGDERDDGGAEVTRLPVAMKPGPLEPFVVLEFYAPGKCQHGGGVIVNEKESEVTCKLCGTRLNPVWVLAQLAKQETRWHEARRAYQEEMKRLKDRKRTKCVHCGQFTPIRSGRRR